MSGSFCDIVFSCSQAHDSELQKQCKHAHKPTFEKHVNCPYLTDSGKCNSQAARDGTTRRFIEAVRKNLR